MHVRGLDTQVRMFTTGSELLIAVTNSEAKWAAGIGVASVRLHNTMHSAVTVGSSSSNGSGSSKEFVLLWQKCKPFWHVL